MATEEKVNLNVNEYVDYLDTDEDMSSGGIDYDNVDAPKDWEHLHYHNQYRLNSYLHRY